MLKIKTYLRVTLLSCWQPPPGVRVGMTNVSADGTIMMLLEAGTLRGGFMVPPDVPVWWNPDVFEALDLMSAKMLAGLAEAGGREATAREAADRRRRQAEEFRVAAALKAARATFADGIDRAIRKGG